MDYKRFIKTAYISVTALTVASTVALTLSFIKAFDAANGYFTGGALPIVFRVFFILAAFLSLASAFALDRHNIIKSENRLGKMNIAYMVFAVLLAGSSVIFNLLTANKYFTVAIIGSCFFAVFIVICATRDGYTYSHIKLALLLLSVLFPSSLSLVNNPVMTRHSNSLENMLTSVFAIAFLMYILYEGKRLFEGKHSRWHFSSMLLASHVGLSYSLSYLAAYLLGEVNERARVYQVILILIVSAFVELELIRFIRGTTSLSKSEIEAMYTAQDEENKTTDE